MKRMGMVVAAMLVCVPIASGAGKTSTQVTLDHIETFPSGGVTTVWSGDILSADKVCKNKRRVLIFRVLEGKDEKRGSTTAYKGSDQPGYYWLYDEPGIPPTGDYYAKVRETDDCKADSSATMFYGP